MNWKWRAAMYGTLARVPFGGDIHFLLQRHVTRSLPSPLSTMSEIAARSRGLMELVKKHLSRPVGDAVFLELGAGAELAGPLVFHAMAARRQIVVDVAKLAKAPVVAETVRHLKELGVMEEAPYPCGKSLDRWLREEFGIEYVAPCDLRRLRLAPGSVDVITSTSTLEHIPPDELRDILRECRRALRDDGIMVHRIDYQDHYSYGDPRIGAYNFLRYSDDEWRRWNSRLHYQNRLRHGEYVDLFRSAGFAIVEEELRGGENHDVDVVASIARSARFAGADPRGLAIRGSCVVLRKEDGR